MLNEHISISPKTGELAGSYYMYSNSKNWPVGICGFVCVKLYTVGDVFIFFS